MKITLKTLKQQTFHVEVDVEKDTVRMLKEKIFKESGQAYPVERQWLIYLGKVMEDADLLSQYNLDDKKFVVVMNKISTASTTDPEVGAGDSSSDRPGTDQTPAVNETEKLDKKESESDDAVAKPKDVAGQSSSRNKARSSASSLAFERGLLRARDSSEPPTLAERPISRGYSYHSKSPEFLENIRVIVEMGYPEYSVVIALNICDNNREAAVEYLMEEAAEMADQQSTETAPPANVPGIGVAGLQSIDATAAASAAGNERPLAFLRENPIFSEMKRLVQEDQNLLPYLMHRIQYSNPDLMRIITENQDEFLAMLNEDSDMTPAAQELETIAAAMVNSLTPSDMDAIDRLKALGYPEHLVIQAYIACERDEYKAAEFLVSQNVEDED